MGTVPTPAAFFWLRTAWLNLDLIPCMFRLLPRAYTAVLGILTERSGFPGPVILIKWLLAYKG